jgi:hypothetical protein
MVGAGGDGGGGGDSDDDDAEDEDADTAQQQHQQPRLLSGSGGDGRDCSEGDSVGGLGVQRRQRDMALAAEMKWVTRTQVLGAGTGCRCEVQRSLGGMSEWPTRTSQFRF